MKKQVHERRRPLAWLVIGVAGVGLVGAACLSWRDEESPRASSPSVSPSSSASVADAAPLPSFQQPGEAKRYVGAMIQGDTRALALLDKALDKARAEPGTDPTHIQTLERLRSERAQRLARHIDQSHEP